MADNLFNLDEFIAQLNQDKPQSGNKKDRVSKMVMNAPGNIGTLSFIPIFSPEAKAFYKKFEDVYEFFGNTSQVDSGEAWFKVLRKDAYGELTEEQSALYDEVLGLLKTLRNDYELSYEELRVRHYTLFWGITQSLSNPDGKKDETVKDQVALYVYPNTTPLSAFHTAVNALRDSYGSAQALTSILTTNPSGRQGLLQITFKPKGNQPGYDCTVNFAMNGAMGKVIDPDFVVPEDVPSKFDNLTSLFLGWQYDNTGNKPFSEVLFKELRDNLKMRLKEAMIENKEEVNETQFENKNNLTPSAPQMVADPSRPF